MLCISQNTKRLNVIVGQKITKMITPLQWIYSTFFSTVWISVGCFICQNSDANTHQRL